MDESILNFGEHTHKDIAGILCYSIDTATVRKRVAVFGISQVNGAPRGGGTVDGLLRREWATVPGPNT
jgi:hypothetical protein